MRRAPQAMLVLVSLCLFVSGLVWFSEAARAEDLVSGVSQDIIQITSNYTGTQIVVFGACRARSIIARMTSWPVASPRAWTMRR